MYSPQSSIHFLARCSNFCKPRKKDSEGCPSNQVSMAAMTSALDEKWWTLNCFFQSREQVVVWRGQIWRIGWVFKTFEAQVGQFLLGCKCPVSRVIVVQEQNALQLHQQRWVIFSVDSLALWKIINEEDAVLILKNLRKNFSSEFLHSEFLGWGEPLCRHFIDCCFVSGS